jgi:hypothetical protein
MGRRSGEKYEREVSRMISKIHASQTREVTKIDLRKEFNGKHHEIYLGDPRKAAPEKLKTVLRQPVKRVS